MKKKPLAVEVFGSIAFFIVLASLAYIALTEKSISVAGPKYGGITHAEGTNAVLLGLFCLLYRLAG